LENLIDKINSTASTIIEDDLDDLVVELMGFYSDRISFLAKKAYGSNSPVAILAFKEFAASTLKTGLNTFLFKSQYWRNGRDINPYLLNCLNKLSAKILQDIQFPSKNSVPICPACKTFGNRSYLSYEGRLLRCTTCSEDSYRLERQVKRNSQEEMEFRLERDVDVTSVIGLFQIHL
jgi:hypothetical protein